MPAFQRCSFAIASIAIFVGMVGCDDAGESVPAETQTQRPRRQGGGAAPNPVRVRTAEPPKTNPRVSGDTNRTQQPEPKSSLPPGTDLNDVFVVGQGENTWDVVANPEEQKTFTVAAKPIVGTTLPVFYRVDPPRQPRTAPSVRTTDRNSVLPSGFRPVPGVEPEDEGGLPPRIICDADGTEMVLIPEGVYPRGSDTGPENARPEHSVYVDAFYMAVHEVTVDQYDRFLTEFEKGNTSYEPSEPLNPGDPGDMPVLGVTQRDALAYAKWAKCRLPSEAEWEKAARGPQGYPYPWGRERPVWPSRRGTGDIGPVMSHRTVA